MKTVSALIAVAHTTKKNLMKKKPNPKLEAALKKAIDAFEDLAKAYKDMGWDCTASDAPKQAVNYGK